MFKLAILITFVIFTLTVISNIASQLLQAWLESKGIDFNPWRQQ